MQEKDFEKMERFDYERLYSFRKHDTEQPIESCEILFVYY